MRSLAVWTLQRLWLLLICGSAVPLGVFAAGESTASRTLKFEEPKALSAAIYASNTNRLFFRFKRTATRSGDKITAQRDFLYPDGKLAASERVVYDGDSLVSFELEELQFGGKGSARIVRGPDDPGKGRIEFSYASEAGARPKTRTEELRENPLVGDMIGPFLADHWDALQRGEKIKCRYIVVPRRETVGFTFAKDGETTRQGQRALIVKMEPTSLFISTLVDPLFFTLEQSPPHHVLEYTGRTTPKIGRGGKWKDLDALTVFEWKSDR